MAHRHHGVEVVTTLGETAVDRAVVGRGARVGDRVVVETRTGYALRAPDGSDRPLACGSPVDLPCGLGTITVTALARTVRNLPRAPADRRAITFLALSLSAHLVVLLFATVRPVPELPPPRTQGAPRPRLVANHTTASRARLAPVVTPSTHEVDKPAEQPELAMGTATPEVPNTDEVASQMTGAKPAATPATTPIPSMDPKRQSSEEAARHFDPCSDGDCGLIPTSRFATTSHGTHAGDDLQLAPREPRELVTSVVECRVDGGCNTVSGSDQNDIRAEIAHHLAEVDACFARHPDATAAVDARIEDLGTVHVSAHDERAVSTCIADVISKLKFKAGERDVTLAFARDHS